MKGTAIKDRFNIDVPAPVASYSKFSNNYFRYPQPCEDPGQLHTRKLAGIRTGSHRSETADRGPIPAVNYPPTTQQ